jgi:2-keto-4-pentenoate hydratase
MLVQALGRLGPVGDGIFPTGRVSVNGELRHEGVAEDPCRRILAVALLLERAGEGLRAGDWIICGAICSAMLDRGDDVAVAVGDLGVVRVSVV